MESVSENCTVKGSVVKVDTENQEYGQCGGILGYIGSVAAANEEAEISLLTPRWKPG